MKAATSRSLLWAARLAAAQRAWLLLRPSVASPNTPTRSVRDLADRVRVLEHKLARMEELFEASTAERDHLARAVDALEYRMRDAVVRLRRLDGMSVGEVGSE